MGAQFSSYFLVHCNCHLDHWILSVFNGSCSTFVDSLAVLSGLPCSVAESGQRVCDCGTPGPGLDCLAMESYWKLG